MRLRSNFEFTHRACVGVDQDRARRRPRRHVVTERVFVKFETTSRDARAKAVEIETNLIKCKLWIYKLTGVDAQRCALLSNLSECMFWRLSSAHLKTNQSSP